ncbi:MAG: hypothetical protein ACOVOO_02115 [Flavobacteriales bacterium]|jgi:hypothetical protein
MKSIIYLLTFAFILLAGISAQAQKRPPKQKDDVQTRENAVEREKAQKAEKQAEYVARSEHHSNLQDKATKKRMKKNLKRSQKHSWGKEVPWYKRIFRRRRV